MMSSRFGRIAAGLAVAALVAGAGYAAKIKAEAAVDLPGADGEGAPDLINTGDGQVKAIINDDPSGLFRAKLKGSAPNASGAKQKYDNNAEIQDFIVAQVAGAFEVNVAIEKSTYKLNKKAEAKARGNASGSVILEE